MTILADLAAGAAGRALRSFLPRFAKGAWAPSFLLTSRLARNGRDWHTLLEFCGLVRTLIVDEEGVYDSGSINDRLLLGMKGTMSEMELSVMRQRSVEAMKQKARRGELFLTVVIGYVKVGREAIEKDPDRRVQEALAMVFRKFAELQTIRQVLVWLRQEKSLSPCRRTARRPHTSHLEGAGILDGPIHFDQPDLRGGLRLRPTLVAVMFEDGRKKITETLQRDWRAWEVLIRDHHESYIDWAEFERNQRLIADNTNGKRFMSRGFVRCGEALLPGLFRCARCGRKLNVYYGGEAQRYVCAGAFSHMAAALCISFGGLRVDRAIAKEVLDRLQPIGVEAALCAIEARGQQRSEKQRQLEFALQQARYDASRAQRQYDAIDPDNRLVADELERRWNGGL